MGRMSIPRYSVLGKYREDQTRDSHGRWSVEGGSGDEVSSIKPAKSDIELLTLPRRTSEELVALNTGLVNKPQRSNEEAASYIAHYTEQFRQAGGRVIAVAPNEEEGGVLKDLWLKLTYLQDAADSKHRSLLATDGPDSPRTSDWGYLSSGVQYTRDALANAFSGNGPTLVAVDGEGRIAGALSYEDRGSVLAVDMLGSLQTLPGIGCALQAALLEVADADNKGVDSVASFQSVPFHYAIGRELSVDVAEPDSRWSKSDVHNIFSALNRATKSAKHEATYLDEVSPIWQTDEGRDLYEQVPFHSVSKAGLAMLGKYSPDQARDERGRFTSGAGGRNVPWDEWGGAVAREGDAMGTEVTLGIRGIGSSKPGYGIVADRMQTPGDELNRTVIEPNNLGSGVELKEGVARWLTARAVVQGWHGDSGDETHAQIQESARRVFGLTEAKAPYKEYEADYGLPQGFGPSSLARKDIPDAVVDDVMRAQYDATQEMFARAGLKPDDTVTLWRSGTRAGVEDGTFRPLTSWTASPSDAGFYLRMSEATYRDTQFVTYKADIPVKDIASTFLTGMGDAPTSEFIVMGKPRSVTITDEGRSDDPRRTKVFKSTDDDDFDFDIVAKAISEPKAIAAIAARGYWEQVTPRPFTDLAEKAACVKCHGTGKFLDINYEVADCRCGA